MGLDITVVMVDWGRLNRVPAGERVEALIDAVCPDFCCVPCAEADVAVTGGWVWPRGQEQRWCAEYRFVHTTGSYKWHFELSNAWDDMREFTAPDLRVALDTFLGGLVWDGPDDEPVATVGANPWHARLLLFRPPDEVPALARAWERAGPRLEELRAPFAAEAAGWAGRPRSFDQAVALLREWADVVAEADRRGWGLVGLPY
ncbi:hypothetical protein [Streptomyces sp. NPDC127098]|uniref:hypothetical protein n=1 Tax=Streptomyces sp. NPDC127098 TaxID=3347137 RepID=UPI0036672FB6